MLAEIISLMISVYWPPESAPQATIPFYVAILTLITTATHSCENVQLGYSIMNRKEFACRQTAKVVLKPT